MPLKWLNEKLWPLLDSIHLSEFFEDHSIPPIVLPITLLGLLIILLSIASPSGPDAFVLACGNGSCDGGEDVISCPVDCRIISSRSKTVVVTINNPSKYPLEVSLESPEGQLLLKKKARDSNFVFSVDSSIDKVRAFVQNTINSEVLSSDITPLLDGITKIDFSYDDDFLGSTVISWKQASLRVSIKDALSGEPISANVTIQIPQVLASNIKVESKIIDDVGHFSLESGTWYVLFARAEGYEDYPPSFESFMLEAEESRSVELMMRPSGPVQLNNLLVCMADQNGTSLEGFIRLTDRSLEIIDEKQTVEGCASFDSLTSTQVYVSTLGIPSECIGIQMGTNLTSGQNHMDIELMCNEDRISQVRLKIIDESNEILTQEATIIAQYLNGTSILGSGLSSSLALGAAGYTEFVKVRSSEPFNFQFQVLNLEDYVNFISEDYVLEPQEIRSITIVLETPPSQGADLYLDGLTYPSLVPVSSQFEVIIPSVVFSSTDVTDSCELEVSFAGRPCRILREGNWVAQCSSNKLGQQDLAIKAYYGVQEGVVVKPIFVYLEGTGNPFTMSPRYLDESAIPMTVDLDISFEGSPLDALTASEVYLTYVEGNLDLNSSALTGSNGVYRLILDTPFPDEHEAHITLQKLDEYTLYEQEFVYYFTSSSEARDLSSEMSLSARVLEPGQFYEVYSRIKHEEYITELHNIYVLVNEQSTSARWDGEEGVYRSGLLAPSLEAKYSVDLLLEDHELDEDFVYVIDTQQEQASSCTINECSNIQRVRKCVDEYWDGMHSENQIISCIEQGIYTRSFSLFDCKSSSANRGDFNGDCRIDSGTASSSDDYALMSQLLNTLSQVQRNEYRYCGDMDNDGDVDEEDLSCLQYVIQGTWEGDTSASGNEYICSTDMHGAFCLDTSDTPGDFNGDWVFDSQDIIALNKIYHAVFNGVTPTQHILGIADFNQDGQISNSDLNCLESILDSVIPAHCLEIYDFGCGPVKGDLNGDGAVDRLDILLETWVTDHRIFNACDSCTDLNADQMCTNEDLLCLTAIVEQNENDIEDYCTDCVTKMLDLDIYGEEICHDGYDNDCNGEIDDLCECNETQVCLKKYDADGLISTDDYLYCKETSWAGWQWISDEDLMASCQTCDDLEKTFTCESYPGVLCQETCDASTAWATKDVAGPWPPEVHILGPGCDGLAEFMKPGAKSLCCSQQSCGLTAFSDPDNPCPYEDQWGNPVSTSPLPPKECDLCCVEGTCKTCNPIVIPVDSSSSAPGARTSSGVAIGGGGLGLPSPF